MEREHLFANCLKKDCKIIKIYVKIFELLAGIKNCQVFGDKNIDIKKLTFDSRKVEKGSMFFCIDGTKVNGKIYAIDAIKNGAVCIVTSQKQSLQIVQIVVKDVRKAMAKMSANFFGNPQKALQIVGITGTNGKTSTSYILAEMLQSFGKNVGVIGTSGIFFGGKKYPANLTTPDSIELFEIFAKMRDCGTQVCVMEVSAHSIFFKKIYGIKFFAKILTNVKTDHLDFFKTQRRYESVKMHFFSSGKNFVANGDDNVGKQIANVHKKKTLTFGTGKDCDYQIQIKMMSIAQSQFDVVNQKDAFCFQTNLVGECNIFNFVASLIVLQKFGVDIKKLTKEQQNFMLPGRFDVKKFKKGNIVIDYAHTTSSVETLFKTIKSVSANRCIAVIGAPGERETEKRFLFGKIAGKFCDVVIVTTDNPASENPRRIMFEIASGVKTTNAKCLLIEDRQKAIKKAIQIAPQNTNILIVGKGSEDYQIFGDKKIGYSDYKVVEKILKNKK